MSTAGQVIQCKAAVAWEPGKPLSIEDVEVAPPKVHEVRIKIVATGVCHTDLAYLYEAGIGMKFRPFPLVLGHEAAGRVESIGPEVTKFSPGDKVIPLFLPQCGECKWCRSPKTNLCRKNCKMHIKVIFKHGRVILSDIFQTAFRLTDSQSACIQVEKGSSCAVFGLGAVGLAAVMGCKVAGATRIIGVDINSAKFEKAKEFGATECVNPTKFSKPIQQVLVEMTDGGVDYALECVGNPGVMSAAFESTIDAWGTCVIVGWTETEAMSVVVENILMGRTLKGTYFGGWKSVEDVPKLVDDYMNKKLKLDEFITNNLPLDQINVAFKDIRSGNGIRTVIRLQPEEASGSYNMKN
ncbi:alcohol dehydrogenase class-3-like [Etheostoma cragini]|uniref:alcohol dehydrogenase class-3-like n=1 Tax=Etheostoma cragini TaxID=417921 RepID=UPI00155E69F2|nr:alcohol dehydrogenase class-3-like [Etheostoma cragini]